MDSTSTAGISSRCDRLTRPEVLDALRQSFRQMNRGMVLLFRLGLGRLMNAWPSVGGRILVITHVGRRSGRRYRTPVNYAEHQHSLYCVAAFGARTDWYRNALADPLLEVWLPDGRWICEAKDATNEAGRLDLVRAVLITSGFAAPLFGLHPRAMTDEELAEVTDSYRLLRLSRREPLPGGAGDLAWIWPTGFGLLVVALAIRRGVRGPEGRRSFA
jgi:deazaflavin-dependent oxidoreductase (nitroreductase family)